MSGSDFPPGETRVNCTATDSEQTQAACSFNVIVGISQRLAKTRSPTPILIHPPAGTTAPTRCHNP